MRKSKELNEAQKDFLSELDNMAEGDVISIGGIDYDILLKAYDDGEDWAEEVLTSSELPNVYIKTADRYYEEALYCSYNPALSRDKMIELIRKADILGPRYTTKEEIKQYFGYMEE